MLKAKTPNAPLATHPLGQSVFLSLVRERPGWKLLILGLGLLSALLGLAAPHYQKLFIDGLIAGNTDALIEELLLGFGASLGGVVLLQLTLWLATRESVTSLKSLSDELYRKLLTVRGGLVGNAPSGEAVSLFTVDASGAIQFLEQCLPMGASLFFPLALAPVALRHQFDIPYTHSLGALFLIVFVNGILAIRQSRFFYHFKALAQERTGRVNEWIQNVRTLRILGWIPTAEEKIFAVRRRETANRLAMVTNGQIMNAIAGSAPTFLNLGAVAFLLGSRGGSTTPGEMLSLIWLVNVFLSRPLRQFPWFFVMTMDSSSSMRRLERAFSRELPAPRVLQPAASEPAMDRETTTRAPSRPADALEVRGLDLVVDGRPLLKSVHFRVAPGECVAIVGEVGSGKSLLLQSLLGETAATFLSFRVDGVETRGPADPKVKRNFAFVPQEGFTMSASLRENVMFRYGAPVDQDPEILKALRVSQFDPGVEGLAEGLSSEIGERGVNLSGGQRQRIGLARAQFADRPILLLDDPLSAVDVETEKALIKNLLHGAWKGHARVLVTHRMSALPHCDRILFMEDGRVRLEGTYPELIAHPSFRSFVMTATQAQRSVEEGVPT